MCYNIGMIKITARSLIFPSFYVAAALLIICTQFLSTPNAARGFPPQVLQNPSGEKNSPGKGLSSFFPPAIQQWKFEIENQSRMNGIDANIIAAVIYIESAGDAHAYSPCGAVGLMQVMPRDGLSTSFTCDGQPCFSSRPSMTELFDPRFNIEYGTGLLRSLYNRKGSWREALYSYGPIDVGYDYADRVLSILEQFSHEL